MLVWLKRISFLFLVFLVISQIIRPARINPPIDPNREIHATLPVEPAVAAIFGRSCNDCHSNRTMWPWYSQVAPASWLLAYDVRQGRGKLNFSEWDTSREKQKLLEAICSEVSDGEMPGWNYLLLHPNANISAGDVQVVCSWTRMLRQTQSAGKTNN